MKVFGIAIIAVCAAAVVVTALTGMWALCAINAALCLVNGYLLGLNWDR